MDKDAETAGTLYPKLLPEEQRFSNILNNEELSSEITQALECPSCKKILPPPIYLCSGGHSICSKCLNELDACPKCKSPFTQVRNELAEALITKLNFKCPNWKYGCKFTSMGGSGLHDHANECCFGQVVCVIGTEISCGNVIPDKEFIQHLVVDHGITGVESPQAIITMNTTVNLGNGNWTFPPHYLKAFGQTFLCFVHTSYSLLLLWIAGTGTQKDLSKFVGSITMFHPGKKFYQSKWTGPIHSIRSTPKEVFNAGTCLTLIPETFLNLAEVKPFESGKEKDPATVTEEKKVISWKCHFEIFDITTEAESSNSKARVNTEDLHTTSISMTSFLNSIEQLESEYHREEKEKDKEVQVGNENDNNNKNIQTTSTETEMDIDTPID